MWHESDTFHTWPIKIIIHDIEYQNHISSFSDSLEHDDCDEDLRLLIDLLGLYMCN